MGDHERLARAGWRMVPEPPGNGNPVSVRWQHRRRRDRTFSTREAITDQDAFETVSREFILGDPTSSGGTAPVEAMTEQERDRRNDAFAEEGSPLLWAELPGQEQGA